LLTRTAHDDTTVTGTISIDGSAVTTGTTVAGQDAKLTFSATAGQRVVLYATSVTNPFAYLNLVRPDGSTQASIGLYNGSNAFMDTQTLATSGTYTLWVQHSGTGVGSETLDLDSVPADFTGTLTIDGSEVRVPDSGDTAVGQNATLSMYGTQGQQITFTFPTSTYGPSASYCTMTVRDPSNNYVAAAWCGVGQGPYGPITLPATGTYTLFIDPYQQTTGHLTISAASQ